MVETLPDYIEARIKQRPLEEIPIVPGSTPVISFGDARIATVATLGWNPSKREFLDSNGNELVGNERRLETLNSIGETVLTNASAEAVAGVFQACNSYFRRRPYTWFNSLEKMLKYLDASYYDGSACHLDLVQWATDPVWSRLSQSQKNMLLKADSPFLRRQLSQENIRLLLLNGNGIVSAYQKQFQVPFDESPVPGGKRLKLFQGPDTPRPRVFGWNINLQGTRGVSNDEIKAIATAIKNALLNKWHM